MSRVAGEPQIMISIGRGGLGRFDPGIRASAAVSRDLEAARLRCRGLVVDDLGEDLRLLAHQWRSVDVGLVDVGHALLAADGARLDSIRELGIVSSADAQFLLDFAGLLDEPIAELDVALLALFAVSGVADTASELADGKRLEPDGTVSLKDLRAMSASERFTESQKEVARRLLEFAELSDQNQDALGLKGDGTNWGALLGGALDMASFVPVLGDAVDAARAVYYLANGDWENALIYGIGIAPVPGLSGGAVKTIKVASEIVQSVGTRGLATTARHVATDTARNVVEDTIANIAVETVADITNMDALGQAAGIGVGVYLGRGRPAGGAPAQTRVEVAQEVVVATATKVVKNQAVSAVGSVVADLTSSEIFGEIAELGADIHLSSDRTVGSVEGAVRDTLKDVVDIHFDDPVPAVPARLGGRRGESSS